MTTPLVSFGIDSADPPVAARWWAEALDWDIVATAPDEAEIAPRDGRVPALVFLAVAEPKVGKNRVHLDLASTDAGDHQQTVERLLATGARPADIGQQDVPWVVLADPEGNEFCVLEPRARYQGAGRLAAVVVDAADPPALARFWAAVTGWSIGFEDADVTSLHHPGGRPPDIDFVLVRDEKQVKNRLHPDVVAPDGDVAGATEAVIALGARHVDIGQGEGLPWVVLVDPEGNELCVLPPDAVERGG
jgi:predicted enzyme related to lactoylglutathione lyase